MAEYSPAQMCSGLLHHVCVSCSEILLAICSGAHSSFLDPNEASLLIGLHVPKLLSDSAFGTHPPQDMARDLSL